MNLIEVVNDQNVIKHLVLQIKNSSLRFPHQEHFRRSFFVCLFPFKTVYRACPSEGEGCDGCDRRHLLEVKALPFSFFLFFLCVFACSACNPRNRTPVFGSKDPFFPLSLLVRQRGAFRTPPPPPLSKRLLTGLISVTRTQNYKTACEV